jgi:hypothetical protein
MRHANPLLQAFPISPLPFAVIQSPFFRLLIFLTAGPQLQLPYICFASTAAINLILIAGPTNSEAARALIVCALHWQQKAISVGLHFQQKGVDDCDQNVGK